MNSNGSIHSLLFDLIFLIQIEMKKVVKNTGVDLSPVEILVLRTLVEHGEVTQQQLAQRLSKDKAQITRLIHGLVKKQLILKKRNPHDKRSFVVTAKDKVKKKMVGFIEYERNIVKKMLEGASDKEIKNMEKMLGLMKSNIEPEV
jgi:DNA-binding MarR family transcriptional regulator